MAQSVLDAFREERKCQSAFLRKLGEFDERKLYLPLGFSSVFSYCTKALRLSEPSAAKRIVVARLARRFPVLLDIIARGDCTLTNLWILAPAIHPDNLESLLSHIPGMTKFQAEQLKASLIPGVERRPIIRIEAVRGHLALTPPPLSESPPTNTSSVQSPLPTSPPSVIAGDGKEQALDGPTLIGADPFASSPDFRRVGFHFTASETLLSKFRRAQNLMRHRFPKGDPENVFSEALDALLDRVDPQRRLPTARASHQSPMRKVPDGLRLRVWHRDGGQCTFLGADGKRCGSEEFLEVDHIQPWSLGGKTEMNNLRLLCAPHHRYYTQKTFPERAPGPGTVPRSSA